jgi:hypothetical protein
MCLSAYQAVAPGPVWFGLTWFHVINTGIITLGGQFQSIDCLVSLALLCITVWGQLRSNQYGKLRSTT